MQQLKKNTKGFTIIEVMIVLVIAAVIILIVFLAVPALQRNSRNNQRKSDASRLLAAAKEYQANNSNAWPTNTQVTDLTGNLAIFAPSEVLMQVNGPNQTVANTLAFAGGAGFKIVIYQKATCTGSGPTGLTINTGSKAVAIFANESGSGLDQPQCIEG